MEIKRIIVCLICLWIPNITAVPAQSQNNHNKENNDTEAAPSGIIETLATLPLSISQLNTNQDVPDLTSFPYESYHDIASSYGPPPPPQPSFGVSVNTQAVLAPPLEIVRFLEAFLKLKSELLSRFQTLLNQNWDLGRAIINVIIGKIQKLQSFLLKGVGFLRTFLEFVFNLFSNFSLTLPSLTLGATGTSYAVPHAVYGVPPVTDAPTAFTG